MDLETDSEYIQKTLIVDKGLRDKEVQTRKEEEEDKNNNKIQMRERPEVPLEDENMLTSDGGSVDIELEEALAWEGMNLPVIVGNWKTQGIENASKEEIKKVNDLFTAR